MAKFQMTQLVNTSVFTARLGAGSGAANHLDDVTERKKLVKLVGESRYDLCAAGDEIEGQIDSINTATQDDFSIGAVLDPVGPAKFLQVTFDGNQAAGTGAIAVGAYVVAGAPTAKGTPLSGPPKVRSATDQAVAKSSPFAWRVVSLGSAGTGAVGTTGVIQRCGA